MEGVTQRDPLATVNHYIGVLPLIKLPKAAHPGITKTWYADDVGALVTKHQLIFYFAKKSGLGCGY